MAGDKGDWNKEMSEKAGLGGERVKCLRWNTKLQAKNRDHVIKRT